MNFFIVYSTAAVMFCSFFFAGATAQQMKIADTSLRKQEKSIVIISSLTAKGDLVKLKAALNTGLETGLTINEIKEVLVHLYAYCGFPRSIRGLQTFMEVLNERKASGIIDSIGREAAVVMEDSTKYKRGKEILGQLTKIKQPDTPSGYAAFSTSS